MKAPRSVLRPSPWSVRLQSKPSPLPLPPLPVADPRPVPDRARLYCVGQVPSSPSGQRLHKVQTLDAGGTGRWRRLCDAGAVSTSGPVMGRYFRSSKEDWIAFFCCRNHNLLTDQGILSEPTMGSAPLEGGGVGDLKCKTANWCRFGRTVPKGVAMCTAFTGTGSPNRCEIGDLRPVEGPYLRRKSATGTWEDRTMTGLGPSQRNAPDRCRGQFVLPAGDRRALASRRVGAPRTANRAWTS
jgi:hypothetical protein